MGITGLIPLLKDIQRKTSVSEFHGKSVGIDGYCWLHKGVYGCAKDVVEGKKTNVYINYVLKRINMLLNYNITPVMVFDGGYLPAKSSKEEERRRAREENLKKAKAFLRAGNNSQAFDCFQRCVEITPAMATEVIQACREKKVLCIVAPYEADAQLAYLEMQGITQFTITEDSDLLIYGCKKVLFKMNSDGDGIFIDLAELNKVKTVALESFTMEKFRHMCILSGCDYLPSVKGLGLYKAHKFLKRSTNVYKAIQLIKQAKKFNVPENYAESFRKTDAVFKYQSVFDPRTKGIVRLNEVSETDDVTEEELLFAGPEIEESKAIKIALGNLDPISGESLADFDDFVKSQGPKQAPVAVQTFVEQPRKQRNPKLHYSVDEELSGKTYDDKMFEEEYIEKDEPDRGTEEEDDGSLTSKLPHFLPKKDDDLSPPEKSLRNIHLYEKNSPRVSIGILYDDRRRKIPATISKFGHHSVFVKRKNHKLKNPFRVDEGEGKEEIPNLKSRYFGSQDDGKENEISSSNENITTMDEEFSDDEDEVKGRMMKKCKIETVESPPESKRVKYSLVQYLDSHSKISLKDEASKLTDGEIPTFPTEIETTKSKIAKENTFGDSVGTKLELCGTNKVQHSEKGLPRLPSLPFDFKMKESGENTQKQKTGQTSLSKFTYSRNSQILAPGLNKRSSLFKSQKSNDENEPASANMSNQDVSQDLSEISLSQSTDLGQGTLHLSQMSAQDKKETHSLIEEAEDGASNRQSLMHLQSRSISEPILPRRSSSQSLLGKCKKIGLSRKSKSSLDRVRGKTASFKQSKIEFGQFAYTKKKIDLKGSPQEDVICIS